MEHEYNTVEEALEDLKTMGKLCLLRMMKIEKTKVI